MNGGSNPLLANEDVYIWLQISLNWISGTVPRWLSTLTALHTLELNSNRLSGSLWNLDPQQKLSRIALGLNMFTGSLPQVSTKLSVLSYYDVEANLLSGTLNPELLALTKLRSVTVGLNPLSGSLQVPSKVDSKLVKFGLSSSGAAQIGLYIRKTQSGRSVMIGKDCRFSGTLPDAFGSLSMLQSFIAKRFDSMSGTLPSSFLIWSEIKILTLFGCGRISGAIPSTGGLSRLTSLDVSKTRLSGAIPPDAVNLTDLWYWAVTGTRMSGTAPHIGGDKLERLYMSSTEISGTLPSRLQISLMLFDTTRTHISGTIPEALYNLTSLRALFLGFNHISGTLSDRMSSMTAITTALQVSENRLSGTTASGPINAESITYKHNYFSGTLPPHTFQRDYSTSTWQLLDFAYNRYSGTLPQLGDNVFKVLLYENRISGSLVGLPPKVFQFAMHANALSGVLGTNWTARQSLQSCFLGSNSISGTVPREITSLGQLAKLFLNNNRLSGSISGDLGSLTGIAKLFLSKNALSGSLPSSLGAMSYLMYLDLGINQLGGSSSPSFGSWPLIFFSIMQNKGLDWDLGLLSVWASNTNTSQKRIDLEDTNPVWLERRGVLGINGTYSVEYALMSWCGIKGSIPSTMLTGAEELKSLFLFHNRLSGTMVSAHLKL